MGRAAENHQTVLQTSLTAMLALETMVEHYPDDPNPRINLASLLAMSGIEAYRERVRSELDAARRLTSDPGGFDRATKDLRQSLESKTSSD